MTRKPILPAAPAGTASINVRLSKEAREQNLSKEGMVEDCLRLAAAEGLAVVAVHIDDGLSGAIRNRPGFVAWLDDARECRADHLIAWHVDRMTREGINVAGQILDTIEGKDPETGRVIRQPVRLLDTKGLDSAGDETSFRFQFVIKAEVARAERERMRDRSRAANRRAATSGRWPGGPAPYGFRIVDNPDGPGRVLARDEVEAAFIREAASRVLAGESLSAVVRFANGPHGTPPRRASEWTRTTLMQVLTGHPAAGHVIRYVDGKAVPLLGADGVPVTVPSILTPDESAAIRAKLAPSPNTPKGGRAPARILSGLIRCHSCRRPMRVTGRGDGSKVYRCIDGRTSSTCTHPVGISAEAVDEYLTDQFLSACGDLPAYVRRAEVSGAAAVAEAEATIAAALDAISSDPTSENLTRFQEAKARHEEALAAPKEAVARLVPTGLTIRETWESSEIPERRALLATYYSVVLVGPGRRGRQINPNRLVVATSPAFVIGGPDPSAFVPGTVAV